MANFIFCYRSPGCSSVETVAISSKKFDDAVSYAKLFCKKSNKTLVGVFEGRVFYDMMSSN